ncbi:MAG: hypothetical protein L6Q75_15275 [Burkholderiaceae bacterium]|nr:hypothetical protein [Burkholderiaceae bacterium]
MPASRTPRTLLRWLGWLGVVLALAGVFLSYLSPELAVDLGNRVWSCF